MNIQDSPILKQLPPDARGDKDANKEINPSEVHTFPPESAPPQRLPRGMKVGKTSHAGRRPTKEIHVYSSPEDTSTDKACQDGCKTIIVKPTPVVNEKYRSLFEFAVKGDWKAVQRFLNNDPEAMMAKVMTEEGDDSTVLDIAVMAGQDQLVDNLIKRFPSKNKASELLNALHRAAKRGRIGKVKKLVDELEKKFGELEVNRALSIAAASASKQKVVIRYLANRSKSTPEFYTIANLIKAGHLDVLLDLAHRRHSLATSENVKDSTLLQAFAWMDSYYRSGAKLNFWEKYIYQCIPRLVNTSYDNANAMNTTRGPAIHQLKITLWNLTTKLGRIAYLMLRAAPLIKRIGELKLRHECWLELANLEFNEKKAHMKTPEMLELTSTIVLEAASRGISEVVKLCLQHYPDFMWDKEFTKKLIEEVVRARHVELFRLMNAHNTIPKLTYDFQRDCDLMEAVVEWSPEYVAADISGSAFLMQRELQWFEVLEDRCSPLIRSLRFKVKVKKDENDPSDKSLELELSKERRGKTYWKIFVEQRKDLLKEAGQWMKDTSSSCSLVATLIITVAFAAVFTVPGSNNSDTGIPIFLREGSFIVFMVTDALALFSSVTATLMFLAILTSRYAAEDFLYSLPRKMILGLTFLFLSLAFMLMAFGSALTIVLRERWEWTYIPITLFAAIPVLLFAILQLPLYVEMVESTFWPRLHRPMKIWK